MTAQEILEGITRHRANQLDLNRPLIGLNQKIDEIEWALQALAERAVETDSVLMRLMAATDKLANVTETLAQIK